MNNSKNGIKHSAVTSYFILFRPHQWLKNGFIFLPLFFNGKLFDVGCLLPTIVTFAAFCLAASGIYCLNDLEDVEADRKHPQKRKRPIASGLVSREMAMGLIAICLLASAFALCLLDGIVRWKVAGVIGFYFVMNVAYCLKLKQMAIVDVLVIAIGFVLRIFAGGFASGIYLSHWIVLMTFLLALFLAFAKRRDDVVMYEVEGVSVRKNINYYNLTFMNQLIAIVASITMMCYIMYTVSPDVTERFRNSYVYFTSIFVLAGIIRYLQITIVDVKSGSPTKVLMKDRFIQVCITCWIVAFLIIIYI